MKFHPSIPTLFLTVLPLSVSHPWGWLYEPGTPSGTRKSAGQFHASGSNAVLDMVGVGAESVVESCSLGGCQHLSCSPNRQ